MATYVNDLRLTELATGEGSGTWGTTTNQSLELIGEALGYATQQAFGSDADATTTVADGASDPARAMYFKITSAGSLTATRTLTIAPNTISRVMFIENATTGSQSIAISQGSGANVTILTGKTAVVYLDGAGSGAAVVDAMAGVDPGVTDTLTEVLVAGNTSGGTNIELSTTDKVQFRDSAIYINSSVDGQLDIVADTEIQIAATTVDVNGTLAFDSLKGTGATTVTNILDEDNMASDSATAIATQQSIKAYVDSQVGTVDTLAEILANGNTTGGTDLAVSTGDDITFADSSKAIFGTDGDLELFYNGTHSVFKDGSAGNIYIQDDNNIVLGSIGGENYLVATKDGAVTLYHDAVAKLATTASGISVTGTVTADGLTVDGNPVINGTSPQLFLQTGASNTNWQIAAQENVANAFEISSGAADASAPDDTYTPRLVVDSSGNVIVGGTTAQAGDAVTLLPDGEVTAAGFYFSNNIGAAMNDTGIRKATTSTMVFDTASTERMRIDASGNVGIGTSSPDTGLDVATTNYTFSGTTYDIYGLFGDTSGGIRLGADSSNDDSVIGTTGTNNLQFVTYNGSAWGSRMTLDNTGNVGIGTPDPATYGGLALQQSSNTSSKGLAIVDSTAAQSVKLWVDGTNSYLSSGNTGADPLVLNLGGGNVGIGTSSPASYDFNDAAKLVVSNTAGNSTITIASGTTSNGYLAFADGTSGTDRYAGAIQYSHNTNHMQFNTNGGVERMRIDASGNVGIGTTGSVAFSAGSGLRIERAATATLRLQDTGAHGFEIRAAADAAEFFSANSKPFTFNGSTSELMRIDAGGSVLIGKTTPADLHNTWNHIIIGEKGAIISENGAGGIDGITLADNAYVDSDTGTYAYQTTAAASLITQSGGVTKFSNAASGSAGAALTPVERLRIDATGTVFAANQYTGGFGAVTTSGTLNFDDSSNARAGNGYTLLQGSDTNGPGGTAYYHVFNYEYSTKDSTGNMTQLAYGYNDLKAYMRYRFSGTWTSWVALH